MSAPIPRLNVGVIELELWLGLRERGRPTSMNQRHRVEEAMMNYFLKKMQMLVWRGSCRLR
jgi:hypothetical protein